jgi:acyl carrier protein
MEISSFISKFEESIEGLTPGSVDEETKFQDLEQWDSLAVLTTIAMADAEFEVELSANEILACATIRELSELVAKKRG